MQPNIERTFRISAALIPMKHFNIALGMVLVVSFFLFNLVGHIRYFLKSRQYCVEEDKHRITFVRGDEQSVLMFSKVAFN